MNWKAVPRKRRKHPIIEETSEIFAKAIIEKDYDKAGITVVACALQVLGTDGLMQSLDNATNFYERLKRRRYHKQHKV